MTIFFPDIYSGQAGISLAGAPAVLVKATQGTGYVNSDYAPAKGRAASSGTFFCAYHFLEAGNGAAQAQHAFSVVGKDTPLMLDFEPTTGSSPGVADAEGFVAAYRKLGGTTHLLYFPHWYWQQLGMPLVAGKFAGMVLVSSNYTTYSESGPGWAGYGGMDVGVWQYTSTAIFNGHHPVDLNAYKGTIAQFRALAAGVPADPPPPEHYPAPAGARVSGVALTVAWNPVTAGGLPAVVSYSVRAVQQDGKIVASQTSPSTSALISGLVHGWTYDILIWANGGPSAPPHATLQVTA